MRASLIALAIVAAFAAAGAQAAGFVNNGKEWLDLTPEAKAAYVRGLNDSANYVFTDDSLDAAIVKISRTRCLVEKQVTTAILADMLTTAYTKDAGRYASAPPFVVYVARLGAFCKDVINRERRNFGLPALP